MFSVYLMKLPIPLTYKYIKYILLKEVNPAKSFDVKKIYALEVVRDSLVLPNQ